MDEQNHAALRQAGIKIHKLKCSLCGAFFETIFPYAYKTDRPGGPSPCPSCPQAEDEDTELKKQEP